MEPQRKVQDLLLCYNCLNVNVNGDLNYTFALECKHVMCTGCHYQKLGTQPEQTLYCSICNVLRTMDHALSQQLREGQDAHYEYFRKLLDFTLVPCRRCQQYYPQPNCLFDHSPYSYGQLTLANSAVKIEIRTCGRCKIRSEGARCVRCSGNLDRQVIIKPQKLQFPPQLLFPY